MLIIRLSRYGRKNDPSFRVVLQEKHRAPKGKAIEFLGFYNARLKQKSLKTDRIKYWISQGAQISDTVHNLLVSDKTVEGPKKKVTFTRKKTVEEAKEKEAKAVADAGKIATEKKAAETIESAKVELAKTEPAEVEPKTKEEVKEEKKEDPSKTETEPAKAESKKPANEEKQEK
ncbi:MAG: 30S ribosomal protein S16 [Candidatus Paceibacterota bacterium]|jgi:small subunit ribosomal protein S16